MTGSAIIGAVHPVTGDNDDVTSESTPRGPIFGRDGELDDFTQLLTDSAESSITLLGGDAGIGKTRLLQEIGATCRAEGGLVLVGRCLDLGDSAAPYLPIMDIVRTAPDIDPKTVAPEGVRPIELFESVATMFDQLADRAPVLIVVEDVHWADRATRELLTYQFTHGMRPGVHLVATYRTDDLHRRHPLRPALAEWSRLPNVRRVVLDPLGADPARHLIEHLEPGLSDTAVGEIFRRSGGNPFFTEELVAATMQPHAMSNPALPSDLVDLLLVRTDALDEDPRRVLRAVSVAGSRASDAVLEQLADLPPERLHTALRSTIDAHLLVPHRDGQYVFRHALLSEAVYDDLLPGERVRLHDKLTDILLEECKPGCAAALAMHAEDAGRYGVALTARVAAGEEALASAAPPNAARHFEKAISLATGHPELTDVPDDLPQRAASALLAAGDPHRAAELMREALRSHTGSMLERARLVLLYLSAVLLTDMPTMHIKLAMPDLPDQADELLDTAIGWARQGEDNVLIGELVALKAHYLLAFDRNDEAAVAAADALTIGRAVDRPSIITDAMTTQAKLDGLAGDVSTALATLEQVREKAAAEGDIRAELRALHQLAGMYARTDDHARTAATYAEAIRRATEANARTEIYGMDSVLFAATLAAKTADWAKVDELLAPTDDLPELTRISVLSLRFTVDVARGRFEDALAKHEILRPHWSHDMYLLANDVPGMIDILGSTGDLAGAVATYDDALATVRKVWRLSVFDAQIRMTALLLTHLANAIAGKPREVAEWSSRVEQLDAVLAEVAAMRGTRESLGEESRAWFARARGDLARIAGDDDLAVSEFRESARLFEKAGFRYEQASAELLLSQALQISGELEEARALSDRVLATARELDARQLITQVRGASRGGGSGGRGSSSGATLTPREHDVLELVAAGMTNGQLAAKLFISAKTASVHVSNILAKLGAATRTEAVDLARQRGLLE